MKEKRHYNCRCRCGSAGSYSVKFGNPANIECVLPVSSETSPELGLQRAEVVQYIRPEIIGIVMELSLQPSA